MPSSTQPALVRTLQGTLGSNAQDEQRGLSNCRQRDRLEDGAEGGQPRGP